MIAASDGVALARAFFVPAAAESTTRCEPGTSDAECTRFEQAAAQTAGILSGQLAQAQDTLLIDIINFQIELLADDAYYGAIIHRIRTGGSAEDAVRVVTEDTCGELRGMLDNTYLQARTADIQDIGNRLLAQLNGSTPAQPPEEPYIAVAEDLPPSWFLSADAAELRGILLRAGGMNSHCAILARARGIPCLIGAGSLIDTISDGKLIYLSSDPCQAIPNPGPDIIAGYQAIASRQSAEVRALAAYKERPTQTADGCRVAVYANVGTQADIQSVAEAGAEGIGLLRTELYFMAQRTLPSAAEQQAYYASAAAAMPSKPVIIRTLDVGGDKPIDCLPPIPTEANPYLGVRGIRYCMRHEALFTQQIDAILLAGQQVQLMFPMVATLEEFRCLRKLVLERARVLGLQHEIPIGVMIETPSAALSAQELAEEADFFSIGTNDLTQYVFAADRTNPQMADLNSPFHPVFLRLIRTIIEAAHRFHIPVDICGQAGDIPALIPVWVGLGVDALSVNPSTVLRVRRQICGLRQAACQTLAQEVLAQRTQDEAQALLQAFSQIEKKEE